MWASFREGVTITTIARRPLHVDDPDVARIAGGVRASRGTVAAMDGGCHATARSREGRRIDTGAVTFVTA